MKFEKIKENIANMVYNQIKNNSYMDDLCGLLALCAMNEQIEGTHKGSCKMRADLANQIYDVIIKWDVRNYKTLQNQFPKQFPKNIIGIDLTDNGWELIKSTEYYS